MSRGATGRVPAGRPRLGRAFRGLEEAAAFVEFWGDGARREVLEKCYIEAVAEDMYMYIDDSDGHIVAGLEYLKTGGPRGLYPDAIHELTHIRQRRGGGPPPGRPGALVGCPRGRVGG